MTPLTVSPAEYARLVVELTRSEESRAYWDLFANPTLGEPYGPGGPYVPVSAERIRGVRSNILLYSDVPNLSAELMEQILAGFGIPRSMFDGRETPPEGTDADRDRR